jgi:hypothetical protein
VDYAGGVSEDITPPNQPLVIGCAGTAADELSASWISSDPDGVISLYRYAIGTSPGGTDIINWTSTSNTSVNRNGLGLTAGQTYYISTQARNGGGIWSTVGTSGDVVAGSGTCAGGRYFLPFIRK